MGKRNALLKRNTKAYLVFCAFVFPNLLMLAVFVYRPLLVNFYYSTLDWRLGSTTARVVGLANYREWLTDAGSRTTLLITGIFTVAGVGAVMILGLALAVALNRRIPGVGFARSAIFAPYVLSGVGLGLVWLFIFDPTYGALSGLLKLVGLHGPDWYQNGRWALVMVIIVYVWQHTGYAAIIYLAGLQIVPDELLESAALDGATGFTRFRKVVWPLLSPVTFFILVTVTLNSLKQFDIIKIMTNGGPLESTRTLMFQYYEEAFINFRAGYSATIAIILFVMMLIITLLQLRFVERKVHYA